MPRVPVKIGSRKGLSVPSSPKVPLLSSGIDAIAGGVGNLAEGVTTMLSQMETREKTRKISKLSQQFEDDASSFVLDEKQKQGDLTTGNIKRFEEFKNKWVTNNISNNPEVRGEQNVIDIVSDQIKSKATDFSRVLSSHQLSELRKEDRRTLFNSVDGIRKDVGIGVRSLDSGITDVHNNIAMKIESGVITEQEGIKIAREAENEIAKTYVQSQIGSNPNVIIDNENYFDENPILKRALSVDEKEKYRNLAEREIEIEENRQQAEALEIQRRNESSMWTEFAEAKRDNDIKSMKLLQGKYSGKVRGKQLALMQEKASRHIESASKPISDEKIDEQIWRQDFKAVNKLKFIDDDGEQFEVNSEETLAKAQIQLHQNWQDGKYSRGDYTHLRKLLEDNYEKLNSEPDIKEIERYWQDQADALLENSDYLGASDMWEEDGYANAEMARIAREKQVYSAVKRTLQNNPQADINQLVFKPLIDHYNSAWVGVREMSAADIQNKIDSILGGLNEEEVKQINREKIENFLKKKSEIIPNSKLEDWMDLSSPEKQVVLGDFNKEEIKIIEEMLPKKEDDGTPRLSKHEPDVRKKQFTLNDSVDNIVALYGNKIAGWAEALKNNLNEGLPFVTKEQQKQIGSISDVTGLSIEEQKNAVNSIQNYGRSLERYKKNVPSLSDGFQFDDVFDSDFWLGVAIPQAAGFIPELAVSYITKGAIGRTGTFTNLRPLYRHVIEGMIGGVPSSLSEASIQANNAKREAIANNKSDKEVEDIYNSVFGKTFFSTLGLESAQLLPIAGLINKSSPNASLLRKLGRGTLDFVEGAGLEGSEERLQEWVSMKELYPDSIGFKDLVTLGNGRLDEATTIGLVLGGAYGGVNIVTPMFETDVKTEMERNGSDKLKEELQKKTQETTDVKTSERNGEIINRMLEDESVSQEVKNEMVSFIQKRIKDLSDLASGKRTIDEKEIPETPIVRRKITINRDPENNDLVTIDLKKYFSGERQPTQLGLEQKEHPNVSFQDATELAIEDGKILDTEEKFLESEYISQRTQGVEHPKISVALPKGWKKLVSKGEQENVIEDDPTQPLLERLELKPDKLKRSNLTMNDLVDRSIGIDEVFEKYQIKNKEEQEILRDRAINVLESKDEETYKIELRHFTEEAKQLKAKEMTEQTLRILERDYDFENLKELAAIENLPPLEHASPESMVNLLERITFLDVGTKFLSEENRKGVNKAIEKLGGEEQIETLGQLKQFFGKITNTPITQQMNIVKSPWLDRFRWDTALAENNPFYKWMVNKITEKQLEAEAKYERIYQKFNRLIKKTGRHKGIQFKKWNDVIQYLEIDEVKHREKKKKTFDEFDDETKNVINFLEEYYTEAKNYLIKENVFQKGRTDYFTHTNRLIMETFFDGLQERLEAKKSKMTAVVGAMKDTFLDIIKSKRETIDFANDPQFSGDMPTSKFFKYSLERVAEDAHYSKDLPKSFLNYVRHFERKRYFDDVLPLIDNFATALKIDEGFLNDYIRNKFGNRVDIAGIKQGTVVDKTIRFAKTGLLLRYLVDSLSQFTSIFGEVASNFVNMEVHKFALGSQRLATKKGNKIANKYPELVDRTPFSDLLRSDIPLRYKTFGTLLAGYQTGAVFANRQYFLGSLTKEEWKSGKVSPERLAEIKLEMGRTRSVPGGKSVIGSTSLLGVVHQYRTWAFPLLRMVATDLGKTIKRIGNLKGKEILTANESKRLIKSLFLASVVYTLGDALFSNVDDEMKKKSVYLRTVDKGLRDLNAPFESLFALGAPPLVEYLTNIKLNVERMINTHVIDFPYYQHNID